MAFNLNEAEKQKTFEPIPDGTFCKTLLQIKPNGQSYEGCEPMDQGLFKFSKTSDAVTLECELTVLEGPYVHRKFVEYWTVAGGTVDDKGHSKGFNMTKSKMRAAIESNQNIKPDDESQQAKATRQINGFKDMDGIWFFAKIGVEEGNDYVDESTGQQKHGFDKNKIDRIVTPDMIEYADLAAGKPVAAKPRGQAKIGGGAKSVAPAATAGRSWGGQPATKAGELPLTNPAATPPAQPAAAINKPAWLRR